MHGLRAVFSAHDIVKCVTRFHMIRCFADHRNTIPLKYHTDDIVETVTTVSFDDDGRTVLS